MREFRHTKTDEAVQIPDDLFEMLRAEAIGAYTQGHTKTLLIFATSTILIGTAVGATTAYAVHRYLNRKKNPQT